MRPFAPIYPPDPNSFRAKMWANNVVEAEESTKDTVVEVLASEPELRMFDGGWMRTSQGSGQRPGLAGLCSWLLAQTLLRGSESAVRRLEEFVEGKHRAVLEILALTGIAVEEKIELPRGVSLVPFASVPQSDLTDLLAPEPVSVFEDSMRRELVPVPSAALVIEIEDGVELLEEFPNPLDNPPDLSTQVLLHRIAECLTLLGPSCPAEVTQWVQLGSPENVPILGTGYGYGNSFQEVYPREITTLKDHEEVRELVERYLDLDDELATKLAIPIRRLNMAMRRADVVDKAIELGIALEALLTADRPDDAPVSYLLKVRGAWLGGGPLQERKENRKLLDDAYDLRSQAVHSGKLKVSKKLPAEKARERADEILGKSVVLCAKLLRTVIEWGSVPDWNDVILTADLGGLPGDDVPPS